MNANRFVSFFASTLLLTAALSCGGESQTSVTEIFPMGGDAGVYGSTDDDGGATENSPDADTDASPQPDGDEELSFGDDVEVNFADEDAESVRDYDAAPEFEAESPDTEMPQPESETSGESEPDTEAPPQDLDLDGISDALDNCPNNPNTLQEDADRDGIGDACTIQDGTPEHPFIIPGDPTAPDYTDMRDTRDATSHCFDTYPGYESLDESGPEYVYIFRLDRKSTVTARIAAPEPVGTDVDLHLLSSLDPPVLVARGNLKVAALLEPGLYYLILDTYVSAGAPKPGPYGLTVSMIAWHAGTVDDPIIIGERLDPPPPPPFTYYDSRDTGEAASDVFDSYPPNTVDESGPEYVYVFSTREPVRFGADIVSPEPAGTDIDLQLLSSLDPPVLIDRGNYSVYGVLEPGTYYLILDTYVSGGTEMRGSYSLQVNVSPRSFQEERYFNGYILQAVDYLYAEYGLLGYSDTALTHDIAYGSHGFVYAMQPPWTMCVAAVLEVMLEAMNIYAADTGDETVHDFLPVNSWSTLCSTCIRAHVWVNHALNSYGTADALRNFGMGENVPFEELRPGSVININRTTGTGHAVIFIAFIDIDGNEYEQYGEQVIGFKYFSSQGGYDAGTGGFDYRYAIFSTSDFEANGYPEMPYKRDIHVIRSDDQQLLNTGMMFNPHYWTPINRDLRRSDKGPPAGDEPVTIFDAVKYDGRTVDDLYVP